MKARIFRRFGLALMLAAAPFIGGCDQEQAQSAPVPGSAAEVVTSQPPETVSATDTNGPATSDTDGELANAPGKLISTPGTASTNSTSNPRLTDLVKLVQAGVGESVLTAYVTNSATPFNVSSDDILYLNDLGTPETVITAMLQRDQQSNSNPGAGAAVVAPPPQPEYANPTPAPVPYTDQNTIEQATANTAPLTPSADVEADVEQAPNTSYSYFYDSLSPYGNWVDIQGYGPCWQPTAVVANPGWQPYCDRGHWAYTDCGWCWVSDYSWGWAPFHYGRWFHNTHWGWCWAPDTTWSPAWVSWRYSDAYCGWAPLPPTACYRPGFGFTYHGRGVGFNFGFGIGVNNFTFVSIAHFNDRHPSRYRVEHREVTRIYNTTTINNRLIRGNNNTLINRGVPVDKVALATRTKIQPIRIHADANAPRQAQLDRGARSLSVYRPALPTPKTTVAPRLAGEGVPRNPQFNIHSRVDRTPVAHNPVTPATPDRRPTVGNSGAGRAPENPGRNNNQFNQPNDNKPGSLLMRGPNTGSTTSSDAQRTRTPQLQTPAQPNSPADNNRRVFNTPGQQPNQGAPQNQPTVNRANNDQRRIDQDQQRQQRELLQQQQRESQQQLQLQAQQERQAQQQQRQLQQQQQQQQQRQLLQQQRDVQQQQQRDLQQRQDMTPRVNNGQNFNPGNRSTPAASPRLFESRSAAPEMRTVTPPSAPAHIDSGGGGQSRGGGGNSGGGGGNGGGGHSGGGGGGGGGNNNNGGGGGNGGGHR